MCFLAALEAQGLLELADARDTERLRAALTSGQPEEVEDAIDRRAGPAAARSV